MFARSTLVRAALASVTDLVKRPATSSSSMPTVSPAVVRSLYRSLYREVHRLDRDPVLKVLFPVIKELQTLIGAPGALHVPGGKSYTAVLRGVFRDTKGVPKISLAFDTLTRLRAHHENVKEKLPSMERDRLRLLASLRNPTVVARRKDFFRAQVVTPSAEAKPKYVQAAPGVPTRVVLREAQHSVDLHEGTFLLAHPLSSAHVDRRVMLITERTPVLTSAVVLDLQFTYPLSRGNLMFPEVFWGNDVYDGGFSQIGFTMPPTAQVAILHTLEPSVAVNERGSVAAASSSPSGASSVMSWLKWKDAPSSSGASAVPATVPVAAMKKHHLFCQPLVHGGTQDDGTRDPTLYLSKAEALPYLAELAQGQPRSTLRVYWGNMRWTTAQLEAEVANGHWMAVKASPSFFRSYALTGARDDAAERFPTAAQLADAKRLREKRYGADITPLQVFPPDQILRRRECLWDEIMYAMGGEYAALVGCSNPFSDTPRGSTVQILAPYLAPLPLTADENIDTAAANLAGEDPSASSVLPLGEEDEGDLEAEASFAPSHDTILEHTAGAAEEDLIHDGVPGEQIASKSSSPPTKEQPHSSNKTTATPVSRKSDDNKHH